MLPATGTSRPRAARPVDLTILDLTEYTRETMSDAEVYLLKETNTSKQGQAAYDPMRRHPDRIYDSTAL